MLRKLGIGSLITSDPEEVMRADKLILPGVGAFAHGMHQLRALGLRDPLQRKATMDRIPILGICLGMQLFARRSDEGNVPGLGWLQADAVAFDRSRLASHDRVPNMGWGEIAAAMPSRLFTGTADPRFYFVHSYHLSCDNPLDVTAFSTHGYAFEAAVERDNIIGVQFHPEKSHRHGMAVLRNFVELY